MSAIDASGSGLGYEASIAVAKKAQDQVKSQGDAAVALIQAAAEVAGSSRGSVAAAPGAGEPGRSLDVTG